MKKLLSLFLVTFLFTQDYSLYFDGIDDYVSIPALSESIENSNATLMGWFKLDTYPIQSHGGIFGFRNYSSNGYGNFFAVILGSPDAEHNNIECMMNSDTANIEGPFTDSNFYHIAITYNGSSFSSYLNGVLQNTVNTSYVGSGSPLDLFIGKNAGWEDYFFNGLIDDVSLWNLSLSDSEIQSYMQEEILGNEEGLIGYWKFDENDGNIAYDQSVNQNHGSIYGAQWISNDEILGCTDELACNYNEAANVEDGTCEYSCHDNGDYSLSFDGDDDYVDLGSQLDIIGDFTIEANIMISDSGNDEQVYTIFSKSDETYTSGPPKGYMLEIYHRELHFGYRLTNGGSWEQINSNTTIDYDVWYNISVSRSNNEIQISIDGSPVGSGTLSEEITFPDSVNMNIGRFWMGDFGYDNEYHFHGMIKNFSLTIDNENLIGQWSFYKGEGDILYDYSGNQNHGTIYGAQWTSNVVVGDSNLDGNIDVLDVITVVNYIINNDDLNDQQFQVSDLNNSGDINITDIVLLVELILNS